MANKKITRADTVTIPSPRFKRGEARDREFAAAKPGWTADAEPFAVRSGGDEAAGLTILDTPKLAYDVEALRVGSDPTLPEKKLKYDVSALPGRPRFYITERGMPVVPTTGIQALNYYGVNKKAGVDITNLAPVMIPVIGELSAAAQDLRLPRPVITSGRDSKKHLKTSLHYRNKALDFRGNDITDTKGRALGRLVQARLGSNYDAFFEPGKKDPTNDHIHAEYDPKIKR